MPRVTYTQTNFSGGQLSPRLAGRVDIAKYENSLKTLENMYIVPQGGAVRRGGSKYIASGKTNTKKVRLVNFEFSTSQAYILEFGDLYVRVYKDRGVIETGSPSAPVEVATTYTEAELFELTFIQSADVLYIAHKDHVPATLSRTSHTAWALADYALISGPLQDVNVTATTLRASGTSGSVNITASSTTGINDNTGWQSTDVGRIVEIDTGSTKGHAVITSITSTTIAVATTQTGRDFGNTSGYTAWALGHFAVNNYPQAVSFYEQRLVWAGPPDFPQLMAFSLSGDFPNHLAGSEASDALVYTIATDQVNAILWLNAGPSLIVGTAGAEFIVAASSAAEALTPTNVRVTRQTQFGSGKLPAIRISNVVLFIQRALRKVREFVFKFESDTFVAPDLNLLSDDITQSGIVDWAYQQEPDSIVWVVLGDGTLLSLTYQRDQEVVAWTKHIMGGVSDTSSTQPIVESVAVIPATADDNAGIDEVWVSVLRWVNGAQARHVEVITPGLEDTQGQELAFFLDSGLSLNAPLTITGVTQANPVVVTSASHGMSDGGLVDLRDISGTTELNNKRFRVIESAANTFELMAVGGVAVTAASNANPGNIQAIAHGFSTGDEIGCVNFGGATGYNGNGYTITKVDADNFTVGVDAAAFGTWTTGGTVHLLRDGSADTAYVTGGTARVATTAISGLTHLEGESVTILGDGAVQPAKTVSSGAITLDTAASIVHAGLSYTSKLVTLNIEAGAPKGSTAQSKTKRIHEVSVRMLRSIGLQIGTEGGTLDVVPFRGSDDLMNSPPALFTGDKQVPYNKGYETQGNIEIQQTQPLPMHIISLVAHIKTND